MSAETPLNLVAIDEPNARPGGVATLSSVEERRGGGVFIVDFYKHGNSAPYRTGGWSGQESTHVWTLEGSSTLRLPPTGRTDLRVGREFKAWRDARGVASVEALNVFNHQSVSSVNERAYLVGTAVNGVTPLVFQSAAEIAA